MSENAWLALQSAAEDEVHRYLSCLATLAESNGRKEPLERDFLAVRKLMRLQPLGTSSFASHSGQVREEPPEHISETIMTELKTDTVKVKAEKKVKLKPDGKVKIEHS